MACIRSFFGRFHFSLHKIFSFFRDVQLLTSVSEEALPALANEALTLFPFSCYLALPLTSKGNLKTINLLVLLDVRTFTRTFCGGGVADDIVSMYLKLNNFLQSVQ